MKKYIYLIISLFLFIPIMVNAETLTYEVCESGCEYANLDEVNTAIRNIGDLSNKDIIINMKQDFTGLFTIKEDSMVNSITINGNNHSIDNIIIAAQRVTINDLNVSRIMDIYGAQKIKINNSNIITVEYLSMDSTGHYNSNEIDLSNVLYLDELSLNNLKTLALDGNIKIENMNFSNQVLMPGGGIISIYNCIIDKVINYSGSSSKVITNIYNSQFNSLKYRNSTFVEDAIVNEIGAFFNSQFSDSSMLNYDIYDFSVSDIHTNTTVYFDKEAKLKPGDKLNLADYLDYYTEDKEIEYTIEDKSIAKIENRELIALKEGNTKVTVTTDEGHVVYRINLVVEKETIPEKIDKMTIKVPITGSKIKAWIVVISVILLGIIGVCSYMLIKKRK